MADLISLLQQQRPRGSNREGLALELSLSNVTQPFEITTFEKD